MKLMLKIAGGVVLAFVLLTAGCAALIGTAANQATKESAWQVKIDAPDGACWSGAIGSATRDGCGSRTLDFSDMAITSAVVQKQSDGGWTLHVELLKNGESKDSEQTSAEYGVATVTASDF